ncbi:MAG TPA: HDOD domain-containing protein [Verrucomicrobiae bacterium]|nr:HDOD domain-containing protein [Verrucomicrobiae bacterium]
MEKRGCPVENNVLDRIDGYIAKADLLPPAPAALTQLLTLLREPNADSSAIIDILAYDPSLTASVLRLSNSAFFAGRESVKDLYEAVMRLGFAQVYQLVAVVCGARSLVPSRNGGSADNRLWTHSVSVALAAELLAKDLGAEPSAAFTAGLLHDIGKLVLSLALNGTSANVAHELDGDGHSPLEIEMKLLGVNHAQIGGRLLERWKLPENLVSAVRHHHQPNSARDQCTLAACVALGNFLAYFMGHGYNDHSLNLKARDEALKILNLSAERLPEYMSQSRERFKAVKALHQIQ